MTYLSDKHSFAARVLTLASSRIKDMVSERTVGDEWADDMRTRGFVTGCVTATGVINDVIGEILDLHMPPAAEE